MDREEPSLEELMRQEAQREARERRERLPIEESADEEPAGATGGPQAEAESDLHEGRDVP